MSAMPLVSQPVPEVTESDVQRIVCRDFAPESWTKANEILSRYDLAESQSGGDRVRAAILKLAHGDVRALEVNVAIACVDFRDVIATAEYPQFARHSPSDNLSQSEKAALVEADWVQYNAWFHSKLRNLDDA